MTGNVLGSFSGPPRDRISLERPYPLADSTVGVGFHLRRGWEPGVAARLELDRPLDLSPATARHLAAWLAAYAEDCHE